MTIRRTPLLACVLLLLLMAGEAVAGWGDRLQGLPVLQYFPLQQLGMRSLSQAAFQDRLGRLFFGGDELLVYDGHTWRRYPADSSSSALRLALGPDGRIWAGGFNRVGYYDETPDGGFKYTSLLDRLPASQRSFDTVWGCGVVGSRVYFVCTRKVLSWDGHRFTVADFPTASRLGPAKLGQEFWFTHAESGLYRLTPGGARLEYPADALPKSLPMHLFHEGGEIRAITNEGIVSIGHPDRLHSSPELARFGVEGRVSAAVPAPGGGFFVSTLNRGLAVVSASGEIRQVLDQGSGLSSNLTVALLCDRENGLWAMTSNALMRLDASGACSLFDERNGLGRGDTTQITTTGDDLWVLNSSGVHRLDSLPGQPARFNALPALKGSYNSLAACDDGLLLTQFRTLDLYADGKVSTVASKASRTLNSLTPYRHSPGTYFFRSNRDHFRAVRTTDGRWRDEPLNLSPMLDFTCKEDDSGQLWFGSEQEGVTRFNPADGSVAVVRDDQPANGPHFSEAVEAGRGRVYFSSNGICYRVNPTDLSRTRLGAVPDGIIRGLRLSADGTRLYALFSRVRPDGPDLHGLGYFLLAANSATAPWVELQVPGIDLIGQIERLLLRPESGADSLWLGGSEQVLRVRLAELEPYRPPAAPYFDGMRPGPAASAGVPTFPYADHKLTVRVESPEPIARRTLLFQTRLGEETSPWSAPGTGDSFQFTNLREGSYTFAVRSVNPAGQVSPAAEYRFRILPPWYRSGWAYSGGLIGLAAAVIALVQVRERRVRRRNAQLERLVAERTAELVKANAAKDEFLAGISHEIRNPMNGVVGLTAAIDTSGLDEASRQRFAYLRHCATHLSHLLEDILDFSKVQAGAIVLDPKPFAPRELAESLVALTATESQRAGLPVEIAVSPAVPPWLLGDVARIRQVLLNFIINALKYAGRGTVCLTVWARPVSAGRHEITFTVSDDGPGISAEERKRLFTRFTRGAAARAEHVPGAGLGLALCRVLAEKMGGRIWVESEPGEGSTFYLALPLPEATAPPAEELPAPASAGDAGTALIVDDEEYNRLALASHLAALGYAAVPVGNGSDALAEAGRRRFDAVFLDFDLPGRSGPEVARELRRLAYYPPEVPIIATTAFNTPEKRALCLDAGMTGFLSKPVTIEKLRAALESASVLQPAAARSPAGARRADPLATLRLIAERKGVPFADELDLYLRELAAENEVLRAALAARDSGAAARAAHKLTGRLAFVRADTAESLARQIEAAAAAARWSDAQSAWERYEAKLPSLRERFTSAASG